MSRAIFSWQQLHFRRPLEPERVEGLLRQWATDQRSPHLVLETRATRDGVSYLLGGHPRATAAAVRLIPQLLPGTTLVASDITRRPVTTGGRVKASTRHRPLRPDDPQFVVRALLSALTAVRGSEQLVVQTMLGPRRVPLAVPTNSPSAVTASWYDVAWHGNGGTLDGEKRAALRQKVSDHGFACTIRLGVVADTADRRRALLLGLLAALRTSESAGLQLKLRREPGKYLDVVKMPWLWPLRLNVHELSGLLAWPLGDDDLPGQPAAHPKRLLPAPGTTGSGIIVAKATAPGIDAALALDVPGGLHHVHVLGPTGTGKSTVLGNMISQHIAAGLSVVVVEPRATLSLTCWRASLMPEPMTSSSLIPSTRPPSA